MLITVFLCTRRTVNSYLQNLKWDSFKIRPITLNGFISTSGVSKDGQPSIIDNNVLYSLAYSQKTIGISNIKGIKTMCLCGANDRKVNFLFSGFYLKSS